MRVFIISPANCATGGTELVHQFARSLIDCGVEAYMLYPDSDGISCPVPEVYWKYNVPYVSKYVDSSDSVLVLAETSFHHIHLCQRGVIMAWWLSVDNYILGYKDWGEGPDIFNFKARTNVLHFVQSYYAKDFLEKSIGISEVYFLGDYISDEIVGGAALCREKYQRKNICLFNPKKGYDRLEPVIRACRKDIQWVPLTGYKPLEMALVMCQAKLYVDFGNHPGKDRIPREAAVCGCCVLTNREGSAAFQEDVGIPEQYKLDTVEDAEAVLETIYDLIDHYEERVPMYSDYVLAVEKEKEEFIQQVHAAIVLLEEYTREYEHVRICQDNLPEHDGILNSFGSAADQIQQLASKARAACQEGREGVIHQLLTMDYVIQVMRESIYTELDVLSHLDEFTTEKEDARK